MTPHELWGEAQALLEQLAGRRLSQVEFVDDRLVDYGMPERIYVRRSTLFGLSDEPRWSEFLVNNPSWIHLNLLSSDQGDEVVTLRRSQTRAASGISAVNVSAETLPLTIEQDGGNPLT